MFPSFHSIFILFVTTFIIQLSNLSVQPIVTFYLKNLVCPHTSHIETISVSV
ncbi:multidrug efflux MFS transporter, partial [Bacillus cereus]|nr:multidrug efflux MFS transporter [Bacillus cereus]